jgi:hypothetical protein
MLFEVDIEPVCVMVISVGGCSVIGHLALYAEQGNPVVTLWLIVTITGILLFSLNIAGQRITPQPRPKYA